MKRCILLFISFILLGQIDCQQFTKLNTQLIESSYQIPCANQIIKLSGKNVTNIVLNSSQTFVARNQDISVLSDVIKDSSYYLIIYYLTGEDTNTFYPHRYHQLPFDSVANFTIEINNKPVDYAKQFLSKQEVSIADSINYTINFSPLNNQYSTVAFLKPADTISLHCMLLGSPGNASLEIAKMQEDGSISKELFASARPHTKWIGSWKIKTAELIIIKIN